MSLEHRRFRPRSDALLDHEREIPPLPATVRARALARARAAAGGRRASGATRLSRPRRVRAGRLPRRWSAS